MTTTTKTVHEKKLSETETDTEAAIITAPVSLSPSLSLSSPESNNSKDDVTNNTNGQGPLTLPKLLATAAEGSIPGAVAVSNPLFDPELQEHLDNSNANLNDIQQVHENGCDSSTNTNSNTRLQSMNSAAIPPNVITAAVSTYTAATPRNGNSNITNDNLITAVLVQSEQIYMARIVVNDNDPANEGDNGSNKNGNENDIESNGNSANSNNTQGTKEEATVQRNRKRYSRCAIALLVIVVVAAAAVGALNPSLHNNKKQQVQDNVPNILTGKDDTEKDLINSMYLETLISNSVIVRDKIIKGALKLVSGEEMYNGLALIPKIAADWVVLTDPLQLTYPTYHLAYVDHFVVSLYQEEYNEAIYRIRQRYTLALLYFSTNGQEWKNQYNFLTKNDVCDWSEWKNGTLLGVICNDEGRVTKVRLPSNNLSGYLPDELLKFFRTLEELDLSRNSISGPILLEELPPNIRTVSLHNNCFNDFDFESLYEYQIGTASTIITVYNNNYIQSTLSLNNFCSVVGVDTKIVADCSSGPWREQLFALKYADKNNKTETNTSMDNTTSESSFDVVCECCICCNPKLRQCIDLKTGDFWDHQYSGDYYQEKMDAKITTFENRCLA